MVIAMKCLCKQLIKVCLLKVMSKMSKRTLALLESTVFEMVQCLTSSLGYEAGANQTLRKYE